MVGKESQKSETGVDQDFKVNEDDEWFEDQEWMEEYEEEDGKSAEKKVSDQQSSQVEEATPTPLPSLRAADNAEGTPLNKAGTVNVTPLPNQIGDCILEENTDCEGQDLSYSDLSPARSNSWSQGLTVELNGSNFSNTNWTGSNLTSAELEQANFTGANLTGVNFAEAFMWEVNLTNANLTDANLSFADIEDAILEGTIFCRTTMPDGTENNSGC